MVDRLAMGSSKDQAAGLRRLFAPRPARIVAFFGGRCGLGTTSLVVGCGAWLSGRSSVLIVDECGGTRGVAPKMGLSSRYDLAQVLEGHLDLPQALVSSRDSLAVLAAVRAVRRSTRNAVVVQSGWSQALQKLTRRYEFVLLDAVAGAGGESLSPLALAASEWVIVTGAHANAVTDAYALIKRLAQTPREVRPAMRIVIARGCGDNNTDRIFENLESVAQRYLGVTLDLLGVYSTDAAFAMRPGATCTRPAFAAYPNAAGQIGQALLATDCLDDGKVSTTAAEAWCGHPESPDGIRPSGIAA